MERNKQVDIIRGVAILLVVLEHALGTSDNFFAKIILSFHIVWLFGSRKNYRKFWCCNKEKNQKTINTAAYIGNLITFV